MDLEKVMPVLSLRVFIFQKSKLSDDILFDYAKIITSPFCFNVLLVQIIENLIEQNNIEKAKKYSTYYRLDGLMELKKTHIFRVRYYAGFKFDHFIRQCVYLEAINKRVETNEDFQTLFNRKLAKPNLSLNELPKPLSVESLTEKIDEIHSKISIKVP
ncbi:MAG: hypothetical protein LBU51_02085 [Bacteroidales bacterium]|jgi:hypothetical protein|nr:hypothetical protein [Bacteroidales bacterium]